MSRAQRPEPYLAPGPARDLVDLFRRLRHASALRVGQIANRAGYAPGHISEVLRGWKTPSPDAAARIAEVLGADSRTTMRARQLAEQTRTWRREHGAPSLHPLPVPPRPATASPVAQPGVQSGQAAFPVHWQLRNPDVRISILTGDLLDQQTHLAVGFSDTFDTSTADDRIIHSSSIQGQLLRRLFGGDRIQLDEQLRQALASVRPVRVESRQDKPYGKLRRYPLGTVAVLGEPRRLIFAAAYGSMGNDLVVRAPVENLWLCFAQLWESVYRHGQRRALSIPVMGSGLARVDTLDHENILRLILLSFVAYSRQHLICRELRIVIALEDASRVSPAALQAFLSTL